MFSGSSVSKFLTDNILVVLLIIVGLGIVIKANTQDTKRAMIAAGIAFLGIFIIAVAPHATAIGEWIYKIVTGG